MNKEELKAKIKKLLELPIVNQAAGVLEMAEGQFTKLPSGLYIPEPDGYAFHGAQEFKDMWLVKKSQAVPTVIKPELVMAVMEEYKKKSPLSEPGTSAIILSNEQAKALTEAMLSPKSPDVAGKVGSMDINLSAIEVKPNPYLTDSDAWLLTNEGGKEVLHVPGDSKYLTFAEMAKALYGIEVPDHMQAIVTHIEKKTGVSDLPTGMPPHPDEFYGKGITEKYPFEPHANLEYPKLEGPIKGAHFDSIIIDDIPKPSFEEPLYPGKIFFESEKLKTELSVKELELLGVVAFELAHGMYVQDFDSGAVKLECGIVISNHTLHDASFQQVLKHALNMHTLKAAQAKAITEAVKKAAPNAELDPLQKQLVEALGVSAEDYKKWMKETLPAEPEPVTITQGAFNALFQPGLAAQFNAAYADVDDDAPAMNQLSDVDLAKLEAEEMKKIEHNKMLAKKKADELKMEKALKYGELYGIGAEKLKDLFGIGGPPKEVEMAEKLIVLQAIVASILLAPREMKVENDSFRISPKTIKDMENFFRVVIKRKGGDFHVTLE